MLGNKRIMGDNIQYYMDMFQIERKDFAKIMGVPYTTLTDWINGRTYQRIDKIRKWRNEPRIKQRKAPFLAPS